MAGRIVFFLLLLLLIPTATLLANTAPVIDRFVAEPAVAAPGQAITLTLSAHDPDCATSCTTGCGLTIRGDLLTWSDTTGRTPSPFQNSQPGPTGSPFTATVTWIAPISEGTYTVNALVNDSGGMLCGGKKTTVAALNVTVTNAFPPVIDSFTVSPASLPVGGNAQLTVTAHDPSGKPLTYAFAADAGSLSQASPSSNTAQWTAPLAGGTVTLRVGVSSGGPAATAQTTADVQVGSYLRTLSLADTRATRAAALADGRIALVDAAAGTLQVMTASGQLAWRVTGLVTPVGVVQSSGKIFVVERGARRISVWDRSGARLTTFPLDAYLPNNVAAGPNSGEIVVADTAAARLYVLSENDGHLLRTLGVGLLSAPSGLATNGGRIAVGDTVAGKILLLDSQGNLLKTLGDSTLLVRPEGLAWDSPNSRLLIADAFSGELVLLGEEGSVRGTLGGFGELSGQIVNPIEVVLLSGGFVLVTTAGGVMPMYQLLSTLAPVAAATNVAAVDRAGDDGGAIAVSWTASSDDASRVVSYFVERALNDSIDFDVVATVGRGTTSWTDNVTDGICYHYRVSASDGVTSTPSAATACAISRNDLAPAAPASVSASAESPFSIRASWSPVVAADLAAYDVTVSGGGSSRTMRVGAGITAILLDTLAPQTPYAIAVSAIDSSANVSAAGTALATTPADVAPPHPESVVAADAGTGGMIDVSWSQPQGDVPVASWSVTATPAVTGWPAISAYTSVPSLRLTGLVNKLTYSIEVTAFTSWRKSSAPSAAAAATPTAPDHQLPIVGFTGWDGVSGLQDAAGVTASFTMSSSRREMRFQYRTSGAKLQLLADGEPLPAVFSDTLGTWVDASVAIDAALLKPVEVHSIEFRNASFPAYGSELAMRRIDFVPLMPQNLRTAAYNTVVDLIWSWLEPRADLTVAIDRSTELAPDTWTAIPCARAVIRSVCRDTFRTLDMRNDYRFRIVSPAGWSSDTTVVSARPQFTELPPPVTDARIEKSGSAYVVTWTPVSTAETNGAAPVAVASYRIYERIGTALALLGESSGPPFSIASPDLQLVVHSVDSQGRESQ